MDKIFEKRLKQVEKERDWKDASSEIIHEMKLLERNKNKMPYEEYFKQKYNLETFYVIQKEIFFNGN